MTDKQRKENRPLCRDCAHNKVCMYLLEDHQGDLSEKCALEYWEQYFEPRVVNAKTAITSEEYNELFECLDKLSKLVRKIVKHDKAGDNNG